MPLHQSITSKLHLLDGIPSWDAGYADPQMRARMEQFEVVPDPPTIPAVTVEASTAPGPHGPVPVRIYRPREADPLAPGFVWLHGGAFWAGDLDMPEGDWVAREVCARAGAVVVSVDYRLAVDGVTYPVPHDDTVAAIRWTRDHAESLRIDLSRLTVGGASAGGNLATGAVLRLRDDDAWLPAALVLAYTTTHAIVPPSSATLASLMHGLPPLVRFNPDFMNTIVHNYLGGSVSTADGYAMPSNADLENLCPVVMVNAEYDDLRTSSQHFAAQLAIAGVDVRQVLVEGVLHGFFNQPSTIPAVTAALELVAGAVRSATANAATVPAAQAVPPLEPA